MTEEEFYIEDLKSKFAKIAPSEYYLSYSGGRDSHFLYWFIKYILKEDKIQIVFCNTGMEYKEIMERGIANADVVLKPALPHFQIKEQYGSPCFTKSQDQFVYAYQRAREKGIEENDMPNYLHWYVMRDTNYDPKGMGRLSGIAGLSKYASDLTRSGKLHKVSPLCCKYLKKSR